MIRSIGSGISDLLYPPRCAVCRQLGLPSYCDDCLKQIIYIEQPFCTCCGLPGQSKLCRECLAGNRAFTSARGVGYYRATLATALKTFKYNASLSLVEPLGKLMTDFLDTEIGQDVAGVEMVMPVPIHLSRHKKRGFNQARLLAEPVAKHLGLPLSDALLLRTKRTLPQVDLTPEQRRENVSDAFEVRMPSEIKGRRILLVDDIMTTGSTVTSCSKTLLSAGASSIYVLALARET
ncbi:MAG: ComF family protein [bacterium]